MGRVRILSMYQPKTQLTTTLLSKNLVDLKRIQMITMISRIIWTKSLNKIRMEMVRKSNTISKAFAPNTVRSKS